MIVRSPADDEDSDGVTPPKKKTQVDLRAFLGKGKAKEEDSKPKPPTPSKVAGMKP